MGGATRAPCQIRRWHWWGLAEMGARQPRPYVVPRTARDLREGLKRMGIERINGRPLARVRVDQLRAVYLRERDRRWNGPLEW